VAGTCNPRPLLSPRNSNTQGVEVTEQELDKQIQQLVQQIDRTIGSAPPQKQDVAQAMQNMTPAQRIAAIRRNNDARR